MAAGPAALVCILTFTGRGERIDAFRRGAGAAAASWLSTLDYRAARRARDLPGGTYVFADLERLNPDAAFHAGSLHRRLSARPDVHCINDPIRSRRRFELLRLLHARGLNPVDVWRVEDRRTPPRWPVFVRGEEEPLRAAGPLIRSSAELSLAITRLDVAGMFRPNLLLVERPADLPGPERSVGILRIGERMVGDAAPGAGLLADPAIRARLWAVFQVARIAYGRLSVAVDRDRMVVWDSGTHPDLAAPGLEAGAVVAALAALPGSG